MHHTRMAQNDVSSRAYRDAGDLRRMQDLLVRDFANTDWRVGDLAWAMRDRSHLELSVFVRLFFAGDALIGWAWVGARGLIEIELIASRAEVAAYQAMLAEGEAIIDAASRAGDAVTQLRGWVPDDNGAMAEAFARRGFAAGEAALQINERSSLDELPDPRPLPPGWTFGDVDTDERVDSRVECHRAAFAPSSLTAEGYRRVRATWPYRAELDRVIVDEHGAVVAACTSWLDEANGEGLLEPVATRPDQQRRGYGRAVCIDALRALREAGARTAQVGCHAGAPACATYNAIGFEPSGRLSAYGKARATAR
jgi:GNAT superfamily N-acetyltransferase